MRIITGSARGAKLITLEGEATRPTAERTKEAIFSMIQFDIEGRKVLDLFAGSGQLALEALSRGAAEAVMCDSSKEAAEVIRKNATKTRLSDKVNLHVCDSLKLIPKLGTEKFDLVFLDPPYAKDMKAEILKKLTRANILNDGAIVVCETNVDFCAEDETVYNLTFKKKYRYGKVFVTMFTYHELSEESENE